MELISVLSIQNSVGILKYHAVIYSSNNVCSTTTRQMSFNRGYFGQQEETNKADGDTSKLQPVRLVGSTMVQSALITPRSKPYISTQI